jgi:hypothetical protein
MDKQQLTAGKCLYNRITGEKHRILYVAWGEDVIYSIEMDQKIAYPIGLSAGKLLDADMEILEEDSPVIDVSCATTKQKEELELRWNLIKDFVLDEPICYQKKVRSTFAARIAEQENCTVFRINQMLYRYWESGKMKAALLPETSLRGGKGKPKSGNVGRKPKYDVSREHYVMTEKDARNIQIVVDKTYNKNQKYSYADGYAMLLQMYKKEDKKTLLDAYPTKSQFIYRARQLVDIKKRFGTRQYNKDIKGHLGSSKSEARGPGDKYQVDATIGDIYLVSASDPGKIIGRPTIYSVVDVFSRAIVGLYVGLENPSWDAARKALFNAFRDKVEYCKYYEIEITEDEWPCKGVPHTILADNGEFNSFRSDDLIMGLGVSLENAAPWRADQKGIVEQSFHKLNLRTKAMLPGAVIKSAHTRGDPDYKKEARLTLYEYTQILIRTILYCNSTPLQRQPIAYQDYIEAGVEPIPNDIWRWGMENRTGGLTVKPERELWLSLLPKVPATITKQGIKYKNLFFTCDTAVRERWFDRLGGRVSEKCNLIIDPNQMTSAYVVLPSGKLEQAIRTADSLPAYLHWTEMDLNLFIQAEKEKQSKRIPIADQKKQEYHDSVQTIIERANARYDDKKHKIPVKKQPGSQIRKNREAERRKIVEFSKAMAPTVIDDELTAEKEPAVTEHKRTDDGITKPMNRKFAKLMEEDE